jgi:hypothetical protein
MPLHSPCFVLWTESPDRKKSGRQGGRFKRKLREMALLRRFRVRGAGRLFGFLCRPSPDVPSTFFVSLILSRTSALARPPHRARDPGKDRKVCEFTDLLHTDFSEIPALWQAGEHIVFAVHDFHP